MLYRIVAGTREVFGFVVLGVYLVLFAIALISTFLMPPLALFLLLGSIFSLVPVWFAAIALRTASRALARRTLVDGHCPRCTRDVLRGERQDDSGRQSETILECLACGVAWYADGAIVRAHWDDEEEGTDLMREPSTDLATTEGDGSPSPVG